MAIIGSNPNAFTSLAVMTAISANSSADGLILIAVSAKNIGPLGVIMIFMVEARLTPGPLPTVSSTGSNTLGNERE